MQLKGWKYSAGLKWIYLSKLASSKTLLTEVFSNQNSVKIWKSDNNKETGLS